MNILLGYGVVVNNLNDFEPKSIFKLFKLDTDPEYIDIISELDDSSLMDILAYAESISLNNILLEISKKSNIIKYLYTGVEHTLLFPTCMPWDTTNEIRNLQQTDIQDEIEYILSPYVKNERKIEAKNIYLSHTL